MASDRLLIKEGHREELVARLDSFLLEARHKKADKSEGGDTAGKREHKAKKPKTPESHGKAKARSLMLKVIMPALSGPVGTKLSEDIDSGNEKAVHETLKQIIKAISDNVVAATKSNATKNKEKKPAVHHRHKKTETAPSAAPAPVPAPTPVPAVPPVAPATPAQSTAPAPVQTVRATPGKGGVA